MVAVPVGAFDAFPEKIDAVSDIGYIQVDLSKVGLDLPAIVAKDDFMQPFDECAAGRCFQNRPAGCCEMADGVDVSSVECEAAAEPSAMFFRCDGFFAVIPRYGASDSGKVTAEAARQFVERGYGIDICRTAQDAAIPADFGESDDDFPWNAPVGDFKWQQGVGIGSEGTENAVFEFDDIADEFDAVVKRGFRAKDDFVGNRVHG